MRIFEMFYVEWLSLYETSPLRGSLLGFVISIPDIVLGKLAVIFFPNNVKPHSK